MSMRPYEGTELQKLIESRIDDLSPRKNQREITLEAGYPKMTSILSMLKTGEAKLALDRVSGLAKALEVDEVDMLRLTLLQHHKDNPAVRNVIEKAFTKGNRGNLTGNELAWVAVLRDAGVTEHFPTEAEKGVVRDTLASVENKTPA